MSEAETGEKVYRVPLQFIMPLPFVNMTVVGRKEEEMLWEEMRRPDGPYRIEPIILRRLSPQEVEEAKEKHGPWVKYEIIDGHTRFRIAKELGWSWIRAVIRDASFEEALEMAYRKNKERGAVNAIAEAFYFKHLHEDLGMSLDDIAERFNYTKDEVKEIMRRAVMSKEARVLLTYKAKDSKKPISGKILEIIASAPVDKQKELAEAVIEGKLARPEEVESAKEAVLQGLPLEEAVRIAKAEPRRKETAKAPSGAAAVEIALPATPPATEAWATSALKAPEPVRAAPAARAEPEGAPMPEVQQIACPRCGAQISLKIDWGMRRVECG